MSLPFFFEENLNDQTTFVLSENTSKHIAQVLRMHEGEKLKVTNGKGYELVCEIISENKKATGVKVITTNTYEPPAKKVAIAISLIKNNNRFEWFLEKATEIGVSEIIPMLCERTEKQQFRYDRMHNILISAMLQSQQVWLPLLHSPILFKQIVALRKDSEKFIAHCDTGVKGLLKDQGNNATDSTIILIGPEGDFTKDEISLARQHNFISMSLGDTRLRTETAGIAAAVILNL